MLGQIGLGLAGLSSVASLFQKGSNDNNGWLNVFNQYQMDQQNAYNERMMQKQFDYQNQLIDKQNEYNSPVNQVKRLKDAGLNPNLLYGSITTGNQSSAGSSPSSHGSASFGSPYVSQKQQRDYAKALSQLSNFALQYEYNKMNNDLKQQRINLQSSSLDLKEKQAIFNQQYKNNYLDILGNNSYVLNRQRQLDYKFDKMIYNAEKAFIGNLDRINNSNNPIEIMNSYNQNKDLKNILNVLRNSKNSFNGGIRYKGSGLNFGYSRF